MTNGPTIDLSDRCVVLAGVGAPGEVSSNGRATALAFAACGARVALLDNSQETLEDCAAALRAAGGTCLPLLCDVTDEAAIETVLARIDADLGPVDILHHNVGIAPGGKLTTVTTDAFDLVASVNLKSAVLLAKHVIPGMEARGHGVITHVSSISSIRYLGIPTPLYEITKAGLNGLTRHIAAAYGRKGIRCNTLVLGMMDTPLARNAIRNAGREVSDIYAGYSARSPTGRMGTGTDTANVAAFLASDLAAYLNGTEVLLDGGLSVTTA